MMHKLNVREHLRNSALYQPVTEIPLSEGWKSRLFLQYTIQKQLKAVLRERTVFSNPFVYIGVPVAFILLVTAAYYGFLRQENWIESIAWMVDFEVPPIGLKETLVFAAIVNGLTLLIRKRVFSFR